MRLPKKLELGQLSSSPVYSLHHQMMLEGTDSTYDAICDVGPRLMGFVIPPFQRELKWDKTQMIRFIESLHLGIHPGTYTYNSAYHFDENKFTDPETGKKHFRCGNWLLDGQQRLTSLKRYFTDEYRVFNLHWSDLTKIEQNGFLMNNLFPAYECKLAAEEDCRKLYDLMAFGSVPHTQDERALPGTELGF